MSVQSTALAPVTAPIALASSSALPVVSSAGSADCSSCLSTLSSSTPAFITTRDERRGAMNEGAEVSFHVANTLILYYK
jgi:hypothetical protein